MTAEDPTVPPEPWGHQIDVADFLGDVVRLMAYVQAGSAVFAIWRGKERDPDEPLARFRSVFEAHQRTEIPRLLISIAAMLRAKVDDGSWNCADESVGWLSQGNRVDPERGDRLGVREACNKVIHATRVHPEYSRSEEGAQFIGALITLHGDHRGELWSAELVAGGRAKAGVFGVLPGGWASATRRLWNHTRWVAIAYPPSLERYPVGRPRPPAVSGALPTVSGTIPGG